jgi:protoporphyrinogen oxidase
MRARFAQNQVISALPAPRYETILPADPVGEIVVQVSIASLCCPVNSGKSPGDDGTLKGLGLYPPPRLPHASRTR